MKSLLKLSIALLALISLSVNADIKFNLETVNLYGGFNAGVNTAKFDKDKGDTLLRKNSPQFDVYLGATLHENVQIDLGYTRSQVLNCHKDILGVSASGGQPNLCQYNYYIAGDDIYLDQDVPVIQVNEAKSALKTKLNIEGPYMDLRGIYSFQENHPFNVFASIGFSYLRGHMVNDLVRDGKIVHFIRNKYVVAPRASAGFMYRLNDFTALKASYTIVDTRGLIIRPHTDVRTLGFKESEVKPGVSKSLNLGFMIFF